MTSSRTHYIRGYIILLALVFAGVFLTVSTAFVNYMLSYGRFERHIMIVSKTAALAEGALEQAAAQLNANSSYTGETNTALGSGVFTITVTPVNSETKAVTATAYIPNSTNPVSTKTITAQIGLTNTVVSFHYGIQGGMGGFVMSNNGSSIVGNVYSGGSVLGDTQNMIYGDVVSSGASGLVYGIHSTGSIYAHTIGGSSNQTIADKDVYYATTKTNTTVGRTSYPGSADQPDVPLPISDAQIANWENQAVTGGTVTCTNGTYQISSSATIGPAKIPCNLVISGNGTIVTVAGHLWVTGNITVQNRPTIKIASSLVATNVVMVADNPADQINSSKIAVGNNAVFQNSGTAGSYIFLISQNKSAETGGSVIAIDLKNNSNSTVVYAAHGLIPLANNVNLKEATAYKITIENNATVTYDTGLQSAVFDTGPGGTWKFIPGTYAVH